MSQDHLLRCWLGYSHHPSRLLRPGAETHNVMHSPPALGWLLSPGSRSESPQAGTGSHPQWASWCWREKHKDRDVRSQRDPTNSKLLTWTLRSELTLAGASLRPSQRWPHRGHRIYSWEWATLRFCPSALCWGRQRGEDFHLQQKTRHRKLLTSSWPVTCRVEAGFRQPPFQTDLLFSHKRSLPAYFRPEEVQKPGYENQNENHRTLEENVLWLRFTVQPRSATHLKSFRDRFHSTNI